MAFDLFQALRTEAKAIPAHPALMSGDPYTVYAPGASRQDAKLTQREAPRHLSAYGGSEAMDHVMNCVDLYASTAAAAAWRLQRTDGTRLVETKTKSDPPDAQIGPKGLYNLLKKPNPFMLYDELIELLIIDLLLVGNGYWYKWRNNAEGRPLSLFRMAPAYVKIIPGEFGPKRYEYQPPGMRDPMVVDPNDVIHFKLPNPHDAYYGMGVVRKGGRALDLELSVLDTMASYYDNRAQPSVVISTERRVPRDVFNKLRAQLRARLAGPPQAGELLVLEAGLKADTLSPSAADALFKEISDMSRNRIFGMFKASPLLFGYTDGASAGIKPSDARREFDTYVMRPFLDKLQLRITEYLAAAWDVQFRIDYNYVIPQDELLKNSSTVAAIPGIKVRELRRALLPLGFLDGESTGDSEIDEMVLNLPGEEMDANGQGGHADRPLAGEAGRPPKGSSTRSFGSTAKVRSPQGKAVSAIERLEQALAAAESKAVVLEPDHATTSVGNKLRDEERPVDVRLEHRTRAVDDIATYIRAALAEEATTLERAMLDHAEGKAFTKHDVVKRMRRSEAWVAFREGVERILMEAGRRALSASVMDQAEMGRYSEADLDYDAIIKGVIHRKEGLPSIIRTAKNRLIAKVQNLNPAATKEDVDKVIQAHLAEWKVGHAENIALSEAVELYNEGTLTVAEETGATDVYVIEEDDAPDQPCIDAKGSVWPIDYAREHRKEHPNCRRAFLPLGAVA